MSETDDICARLQECIGDGSSIILVCSCSIEYWGRGRSVVGIGDRILILKPDSTLIVHSLSGFKPLNWMSPPTDTIVEKSDGKILLHSQRTVKPYEEMKVTIEKVHDFRHYKSLEDSERQELTHNERDMQDYLVKNPHLVDVNFSLKSTGYRSPLGFFDLYGKMEDKYAVIELKSERAGLPAALQLKRYRDWLRNHLNEEVEGILMAPSITPNALVLLRKEKLVYKAFKLNQIKHVKKAKGKTLEQWIDGPG